MRGRKVLLLSGLLLTRPLISAMAETIVVSESDVFYRVNIGDMYVRSVPLDLTKTETKQHASAAPGGSFVLSVEPNAYYTDAGIVIGFEGGLRLGELLGLSVTSSGIPLALTLWLDTGLDGGFLNFNSSGRFLGYGNDSKIGVDILENNTLGPDTVLSRFVYMGNSRSESVTLADLKAGNLGLDGIGPDTPVAIWIGITATTQNRTVTLGNIQIETCSVPEPSQLPLLCIGLGAVGLFFLRAGRR